MHVAVVFAPGPKSVSFDVRNTACVAALCAVPAQVRAAIAWGLLNDKATMSTTVQPLAYVQDAATFKMFRIGSCLARAQ